MIYITAYNNDLFKIYNFVWILLNYVLKVKIKSFIKYIDIDFKIWKKIKKCWNFILKMFFKKYFLNYEHN